MNSKKLGSYLALVVGISSLIGAIVQWEVNQKELDRSYDDFDIFDKGNLLLDEYDMYNGDFIEDTISDKEYVSQIKELIPQFESHLKEIDSRAWEENPIPHRNSISIYLDFMKRDVEFYEKHGKL